MKLAFVNFHFLGQKKLFQVLGSWENIVNIRLINNGYHLCNHKFTSIKYFDINL
jgi:hypothetical protein